MNLGYKGRHELPRSLKAIFGEVRAENPDVKDIIHYHTGNIILFDVLTDLSAKCSKQAHYDFGLRAVNGILGDHRKVLLKGAKDCNSVATSDNDSITISSGSLATSNSENTAQSHNERILENLVSFYMACLLYEDKLIFIDLLKTYYNTSVKLENYTSQLLIKKGISKRNGIIICGEHGMNLLRFHTDIKVYNPLNLLLTNDSIFGSYNSNKEWVDSMFLNDFRIAANPTWFVFDGPILSEWIEDFNSALDDNKTICLTNGERMKVDPNHRFIFVCDSIANVTPATLTRVFLLFLEDGLLDTGSTMPGASNGTEDINNANWISFDNVDSFKDHLLYHNIAILAGKSGAGKKELLRLSTDQPISIINSTDWTVNSFKNNVKEIIYIENFEKADKALQEIVREFSFHRKIGELKTRNIKIVCGIDTADPLVHNACGYVRKVNSKVFLLSEPDLNCLANSHYAIDLPCKFLSLVSFIYSHYQLSRKDILKFFQIVEQDSSVDYLYFVIRIIFGDSIAVIENIKGLYGETPNIKVIFEPKTCTFCESAEDIILSKLTFLLWSRKLNTIVIRGNRLSGKRWLLNKAMEYSNNDDVRVISWNDLNTKEHLSVSFQDKDVFHVYLTINELNKEVMENAIEIVLKEENYSLDPIKYIASLDNDVDVNTRVVKDMDIYTGIHTSTHTAMNTKPSYNNPNTLFLDSAYSHPNGCCHPEIPFDSLYKLMNFKESIRIIHGNLKNAKLQDRIS